MTPSGTAISTARMMVNTASDSVGSSRSRMRSLTCFLKKKDSPRSPCSVLPIQITNWVRIGWSRPSRFLISATCSELALSPAMMAAGSDGVSRSIRNTSTATISITGMVAASLRST